MPQVQNNGTLLPEVTLKISTNDCFRMSMTQTFSVLQWSAMQISIQYSDESVQVKDVTSLVQVLFMEWRHSWTFSGL